MNIKILGSKYKNIFHSFFKSQEINYLIPLIIIFSSLKFYGYVFCFIFYLPYILKNKEKIYYSIINSTSIERFVLTYFVFLLFEISYGSFFIRDFRIIFYWIPLIFTIISAYFINIFNIKKNKFYKINYTNILFKSSLYYFIVYFLLSIFFYIFDKGFYSIQDNLWIGGSSAVGIASIFFYRLYQLWEKIEFRFFSIQTLFLVFFNILANMHHSRIALLYIITFTFFVVIRNIQLKKFLRYIKRDQH